MKSTPTPSLRFLWAALLIPFCANTTDAAGQPGAKPNILFIAVDDLRCDLGCYGAKQVISPNIDRLAASGVRFTHAYCQQSVCNPSRVSIMTGLRPDTTKVWDLVTDFRKDNPEALTIPQHFRKHGYRALGFGKIFHNTFPDNVSWDEPIKFPDAQLWSGEAVDRLAKFKEAMRKDGKPDSAIRRIRAVSTEAVDVEDKDHIDGAIGEQAIAAMRELAAAKKPFFLACGFMRPHLPFVMPSKYWKMYDSEAIPIATNGFLPEGAPTMAFGDYGGGFYELRDYMDYSDAPWPRQGQLTKQQQRELRHGYYASVTFVDTLIGRLLEELDRLGLAESTAVVLWSDHGWKLGEHGGWCKQTNYEIDTRVPLIIRMPGAAGDGKAADGLVELVDVYPTLCDIAGLPKPDALEGESLLPQLKDPSARTEGAAFSQFPHKSKGHKYMGYAMRTDRYRYIEWLDRSSGDLAERELYDHQTDPDENRNIAADPGNEMLLKKLVKELWKSLKKPR